MKHELDIYYGVIDSNNMNLIKNYLDSVIPRLQENTIERFYKILSKNINDYIDCNYPNHQIINDKIKFKYKSIIDNSLFETRKKIRLEHGLKNSKNLFLAYSFDYIIDGELKLAYNKRKLNILPQFGLDQMHKTIQKTYFKKKNKDHKALNTMNVMIRETQTLNASYFEMAQDSIKKLSDIYWCKKKIIKGRFRSIDSQDFNNVGDKNNNTLSNLLLKENGSTKLESSFDNYPSPRKYIGPYKPRRNYWGNLFEEDTIKEEKISPNDNYYYSKDNDNHDFYYFHDDNFE